MIKWLLDPWASMCTSPDNRSLTEWHLHLSWNRCLQEACPNLNCKFNTEPLTIHMLKRKLISYRYELSGICRCIASGWKYVFSDHTHTHTHTQTHTHTVATIYRGTHTPITLCLKMGGRLNLNTSKHIHQFRERIGGSDLSSQSVLVSKPLHLLPASPLPSSPCCTPPPLTPPPVPPSGEDGTGAANPLSPAACCIFWEGEVFVSNAYPEKEFHTAVMYIPGLRLPFSLAVITVRCLATVSTVPYAAPGTLSISLFYAHLLEMQP